MKKLMFRAYAALTSKKAEVYLDKAVWILLVIAIGLMILPVIETIWGTADTGILGNINDAVQGIFDKFKTSSGIPLS